MEKKRIKTNVTLGVIFILIGLSITLNDFIVERREKVFSQMNLELTELFLSANDSNEDLKNEESTIESNDSNEVEESVPPVETPTQQPVTQVQQNQTNNNYETYKGILEIPKINFNKGFYSKDSSLNNVKFNIKILPQSNYPDEEKGNVIIIGHSGNYSNSYFANLYKLVTGDTASIRYENKTYTYKIVNIYTDKKDGTVTIYRNETKNCLTLITCTKDDDTTQTIYILELVTIE